MTQSGFTKDSVGDVNNVGLSRHQRNALKTRLLAIQTLGGECVDCGETEAVLLQIDHEFGGGTEARRNGEHHRDLERKIVRGEVNLEEYKLRCANCHARKTLAGSPISYSG